MSIKTIHQKDLHRVRSLIVPKMSINELIDILQTLPENSFLTGHEQYCLFIQHESYDVVDEGAIPPQLTIEFDKKADKKVIVTETSFNDLLAGL